MREGNISLVSVILFTARQSDTTPPDRVTQPDFDTGRVTLTPPLPYLFSPDSDPTFLDRLRASTLELLLVNDWWKEQARRMTQPSPWLNFIQHDLQVSYLILNNYYLKISFLKITFYMLNLRIMKKLKLEFKYGKMYFGKIGLYCEEETKNFTVASARMCTFQ